MPVPASAAYDHVADLYTEMFSDAELLGEPVDRAWIASLLERLGESPRVADLGCGPGHVTELLRRAGARAVGVDASRGLLGRARASFPGVRFVAADIGRTLFRPATLDGVLFRFSLIHMAPEEVTAAVRNAVGALCDGGLVLASFQTTERVDGEPEPFDHKVAPGRRWPVDTLAALCAGVGLVEEARQVLPVREGHRFPEAHLLLRR